MFSDVIKEKISDLLNSGKLSKITSSNKPFKNEINNISDINVEFVEKPVFEREGTKYSCLPYKTKIKRTAELNTPFQDLNVELKQMVHQELKAEIESKFSHVYKIIEQRNESLFSDHVENHIEYFVYGVSKL